LSHTPPKFLVQALVLETGFRKNNKSSFSCNNLQFKRSVQNKPSGQNPRLALAAFFLSFLLVFVLTTSKVSGIFVGDEGWECLGDKKLDGCGLPPVGESVEGIGDIEDTEGEIEEIEDNVGDNAEGGLVKPVINCSDSVHHQYLTAD